MKTSIYMKQTWIVAAIALSAAACQSNGSKNFTVTGEVKNAPATVVYLEQISFENMPPQVLDSITVTNGKFTLKGKELIYKNPVLLKLIDLETNSKTGIGLFLLLRKNRNAKKQ